VCSILAGTSRSRSLARHPETTEHLAVVRAQLGEVGYAEALAIGERLAAHGSRGVARVSPRRSPLPAAAPRLVPAAVFLGLALALGPRTDAMGGLMPQLVPAERVGAVAGVVGVAGGLGGFLPPLVMGTAYG
jgi:nitrate/nitrite transporter NarK